MSIKDELLGLIGKSTGPKKIKYDWSRPALYALAVGAKPEDLQYTYEKNMKVLPTFGSIPYWAAVGVEPHIDFPKPAVMLAYDIVKPEKAFLNMTYELVMHNPIPPEGSMNFEDFVTNVYDRGEGRGIVMESRGDVYGEDGTLLCTNTSTTFFPAGGGFGGDPMPKSNIAMPDREPDIIADDYIGPQQHLLYRLTGDTNLIHVDPEYAAKVGVGKPIMQGFCTIGFAVRMAIAALIPGQPERVSRISVQMTEKVYPGTPIELQLWIENEGKAFFRLVNKDNGAILLNKGIFEWK